MGTGIGLLYGLASSLTHRRAARLEDRQFMLVVLGGMLARMLLALGSVTVVLVLVPVQTLAFLGSFLVLLVGALLVEIARLYRSER